MIFRNFFPARGGGWMRRYWQYRKQIAGIEWRASDGKQLPPLTLFDFTREIDCADASVFTGKDADGWRISDDRVIGGFSAASATLLRTTNCWKKHIEGQQRQRAEGGSQQQEQEGEEKEEPSSEKVDTLLPTPFLRWYGNLDTTVGLESKAQRSGFCAIRSPEFPFDGANLRGLYNGLEIQCRETTPAATIADGVSEGGEGQKRIYTVNLKVSSSIPEDIYQGRLVLERRASTAFDDDLAFQTFLLPFDGFQLTAKGRKREYSRQLDDNVKVESIGFVLMDEVNGPFQLDLARVRAVNCLDDGSVYEGPAKAPPAEKEAKLAIKPLP